MERWSDDVFANRNWKHVIMKKIRRWKALREAACYKKSNTFDHTSGNHQRQKVGLKKNPLNRKKYVIWRLKSLAAHYIMTIEQVFHPKCPCDNLFVGHIIFKLFWETIFFVSDFICWVIKFLVCTVVLYVWGCVVMWQMFYQRNLSILKVYTCMTINNKTH